MEMETSETQSVTSPTSGSGIRSMRGRMSEQRAAWELSAEARFEVTSLKMTLLWRRVPLNPTPAARTSAYQMLVPMQGKEGGGEGHRRVRVRHLGRRPAALSRLDLDRGRGDITFTLAESVSREVE